MAITKMMDLSTAHMPSGDPEFGEMRYTENEYGYIVFVHDGYKSEPPPFGPAPGWLRPILDKAVKHGCLVIIFDADAEEDDEFQKWEW